MQLVLKTWVSIKRTLKLALVAFRHSERPSNDLLLTWTKIKTAELHHVDINFTHAQIVPLQGDYGKGSPLFDKDTYLEHESKLVSFFPFLLAHFLLVLRQIAVEGCCHGSLDKIYEVLTTAEQREGCKIDLLICCGDFQVQLLLHYAILYGSMHCLCMCRQFVMMKISVAWRAHRSTATWRHSTSTTQERRRHRF